MFEDLLGQNTVKKALYDSVRADRLSHAYVFCGPEGSGRKSFAAEFAKAVMCKDPRKDASPCGECTSCRLLSAGTNPDYKLITGDVSKNSVGIDAVRLLEEDVSTAPEYGAKKVYVIDRSEKLTVQAQNALLKTIEEPPEYVMLIFICANADALIDTVRSRTVRLDFARNTDEEVLEIYRRRAEKTGSEEEEQIVTAYADGIIGRAVKFSGFEELSKLREELFRVLKLLTGKRSAFIIEFNRLFSDNSDSREFLFFELSSALRDLMLYSRYGGVVSLQNMQYRVTIKRLSELFEQTVWGQMLEEVNNSWIAAGRNANYKILVEVLAVRLRELADGAMKNG